MRASALLVAAALALLATTGPADAAPVVAGIAKLVSLLGSTSLGALSIGGGAFGAAVTRILTGLASSVLGLTSYRVRLRPQVAGAEWSAWKSTSTWDIRLGPEDLDVDLAERLNVLRDWINGGVIDLPGDLSSLAADLAAEATARAAGLSALADDLAAEAAARAAGLSALADDLAAEAGARAAGLAALADDLAAEAAARAGLASDLAAEVATRAAALSAEAEARSALAAALAAEVATRAAEVGALADGLAAEAASRAAGLSSLGDDLAAEAATRAAETRAAAEALRADRDRIRQLAAELLDFAARDHAAREELRRQLQVQFGDLSASFDERIITLADAGLALAARVTTVEADSGDLAAQITQVEQARIDGDNALAALVAAVTVGTAAQFDHAQIWYFDADPEGWTGDPEAPAVTAPGWLRPGAGSSALSPSGLSIDGSAYAQLRARIRRAGAPAWLGQLWWADVGQGWDAARRVTLAEPTFSADGIAEITFTAGWSGNVDAVRLDLASADADNYIEIDWIAVGRPAPGASSAELLTEQQARISADSALASSVTALDARLTTAEEATGANALAIDALTTRVEETETGVTSQALRITDLESAIADPASGLAATATALDALVAQVDALDDGSQVAQAGAIRALRSDLRRAALEGADGASHDESERRALRQYTAEATQALTTRIDATDGQVEVAAAAITVLTARVEAEEGATAAQASALSALTATVTDQGEAISAGASAITQLGADLSDLGDEVDGKASATALSALDTRVTSAEGTITAQGSAITQLGADLSDLGDEVEGKASASAVSALDTRVTSAEGAISAQGSAITQLGADLADLGDEVDGKASATALSALDTRVTSAEGTITAQGSAITQLGADLSDLGDEVDGKASASALSALDTRVTSAEGTITAQGSAITQLGADLSDLGDEVDGKASATALSALTATVTDIDGQVTALAEGLTTLSATTDEISASATWRMTTVAGPDGYARIGMEARTGVEDAYRAAGLYIDVPVDPGLPTFVGIAADQFAVMTAEGSVAPFSVVDGVVRMSSVQIDYALMRGVQQSDNYVAGVSGTRIDWATGQIEGQGIVDRDAIADGAITDRSADPIPGEYLIAANGLWETALAIEWGPTDLTHPWVIAGALQYIRRSEVFLSGGQPYTVAWEPTYRMRWSVQVEEGGPWTAETSFVDGAVPVPGAWRVVRASDIMAGKYHRVRYIVETRLTRVITKPDPLEPDPVPGDIPPTPACFRDLTLVGFSPVK